MTDKQDHDGSTAPRTHDSSRSGVVRRVIGGCVAVAIVVALVLRTPDNGWGWTIWFVSAAGVAVIRAPFARQTQDNTITDDRQGTGESMLLALVGIAGGLVPLVHLLTGVFGFADYDMPSWSYAVGAVLVALGLWLFW
ncbi:MAG: hypothetical protein AAF945_08520, partial [Actinomycetota bacterium]